MSATTIPFDRRGDSIQSVGRYELLSPIACGGMAELHLARARAVGGFEKLVALKRILPHVADQDDYVTMFVDEARLAATLNHPNIAQVYDMGMDGHEFFFTMEFIAGRDLRHVLKRCRERGGALPLPVALSVLAEIARGLHYAHEKRDGSGRPLNIIHRDISPPNVIVTYDGGVKIVDFGIAKAATATKVTNTRTLKGKYRYMSPEQVKGVPLDRRSDIFALGILMWELTVGAPLFDSDTDFGVLNAIAYDPVPKPGDRVRGYPAKLQSIVMKALARNPRERFQTAEEVQIALEELALRMGIRLSSVEVARFMREIFHREACEWYQAEGAEGNRAERIAKYVTSFSGEENLSDLEGLLELRPPIEEQTAATYCGPRPPRQKKKRRSRPALVAAAIVAVMLGGIALVTSAQDFGPSQLPEPVAGKVIESEVAVEPLRNASVQDGVRVEGPMSRAAERARGEMGRMLARGASAYGAAATETTAAAPSGRDLPVGRGPATPSDGGAAAEGARRAASDPRGRKGDAPARAAAPRSLANVATAEAEADTGDRVAVEELAPGLVHGVLDDAPIDPF